MPFLYNEQKEANIVIDALASSWWSAIRDQRGDPLGTLNVLTNREMINDPAGKTNPRRFAREVTASRRFGVAT